MNSRRPLRLGRKVVRAASGGVIVIVALLALLFMQGPGTGTGDGDSPDSSVSPGKKELVASAAPTAAILTSDSQADGLTPEEQAALSGNTLSVLIDEHNFLLGTAGDDKDAWHPISLERLIEVAQHAKGDSNGIRVRIQKRVTARASAEQRILAALEQAGLGSDAVFESSELVD